MTLLERVQASNAWDERYGLPLLPMLNNPWIYMAYLDLVMSFHGSGLERFKVYEHFLACERGVKAEPALGLFARWPHGSDQNSHDEIMGAAYFDQTIALAILHYLDKTGGDFNSNGEPGGFMRWNVYRFPWLRPYLLRCSGLGVNWIQQALWSSHIIYSAFTNAGGNNAGGRLRNWLMMSKMQGLPLCDLAITLWRWKMDRAGETLSGSLAIEPREAPILSELAPKEWRLS